ncbi:MAG TPA: hypothetical protein VIX15_06035 [Streptosporangiaceae bacterium]
MAAAGTPRAPWPSGPNQGYYQDDYAVQDQTAPNQLLSEQPEAMGVISELSVLLRDTRFYLSISAGTLAAITIGVALEAAFSARALPHGALGIVNFALLCGFFACWLRALLLLVTSGRPVVSALSELRWRTGAPVDTRAPWLTLPPVGSNPEEWTWIRAHLLVGAARLTRYRLQRADTWTYVTAGAFLVWTAFLLLGL